MAVATKIWMVMKRVFVVVTVLVFILQVIYAHLCSLALLKMPRDIRRQLVPGVGLVITQEREYFTEMSCVYVSDEHVYVHYGYLPVVKVYDLNGNYVCTLAVPQSQGRYASMYVHQNTLYLHTADGLIYEFTNNAFNRSYKDEEKKALLEHLQTSDWYRSALDGDQNYYYIKGQSVIRRDSSGTESVFVKRSPWYFFATERFEAFFEVYLFVMLMVFGIKLNKGKYRQ